MTFSKKLYLYKKAIDKWGLDLQLILLIEEMSELAKEICKIKRGKKPDSDLIEEIVDVEIMLEQIKLLFNPCEFNNIKNEKLERLENRIASN